MAGRYLDLRYLVRLCSAEVFQKQKAAAPKPSFVSIDATGGHSIELLALLAVGADLRVNEKLGSEVFIGVSGEKQWCPKCPHRGGSCVCNPYNVKAPPPSVYLNTNRYRELMALRDRNGANETPPITPKPQAKPSEADIKRFKDIEATRNKARKGKDELPKEKHEKATQRRRGGRHC
eukprot:3025154-Prymnesium_polylepis.1